jgi:hypothetical protein
MLRISVQLEQLLVIVIKGLVLPGKIALYKIALLPQINFITTIQRPDSRVINMLERIIEIFIIKGRVRRKVRWVKSGIS